MLCAAIQTFVVFMVADWIVIDGFSSFRGFSTVIL